MAVYSYTARDATGREIAGTYADVESVDVLREELTKIGCVLVKARKERSRRERHGRITRSEVAAFAYQFAQTYAAGISIPVALEILEKQTRNHSLGTIIGDIRQSVEAGSSLRKAFEKHREIFSDFFIGMLEAGESGGKLATALQISAEYLERQATMRRKIVSAFAYPAIVTVVSLGVVGFLLAFVIPVFSKLYRQVHVSLPGPTRALVGLSTIIRDYWWVAIVVTVVAAAAIKQLSGKPRAKALWDRFKLRIPLFGPLNRLAVVSHFTRTVAMLASVGVSLVDAIETASRVANNSELTDVAATVRDAIRAGNPLAKSLEKHDIFPPIVTQMATSGEQAGLLAEMLGKAADILDKDVERMANSLLTKLEPVLTLAMGVVVGSILMSAYLPMFDYIGHLK